MRPTSVPPTRLMFAATFLPEDFPTRLERFKEATGFTWDGLAGCLGVDSRQLQRAKPGVEAGPKTARRRNLGELGNHVRLSGDGAGQPSANAGRWVETKRRWPELFAEAVETDARMRRGLAFAKEPYLHPTRLPLAQAVALDEAEPGEGGPSDGFGNECEGRYGV